MSKMILTNRRDVIGVGFTILFILFMLVLRNDTELYDIKKDMTRISSLLSQIESYTNSKNYDLSNITRLELLIFMYFDKEAYLIADIYLNLFCTFVNSIRFDFTKKSLKIILPKNINLGNITNS